MFISFSMGNTVVFSPDPLTLNPVEVLRTAVREQVVSLQIVGDAMGRPIIDEIERGDYDLSLAANAVAGPHRPVFSSSRMK